MLPYDVDRVVRDLGYWAKARRCSRRYPLYEVAFGLGQSDAPRVMLEQEDAKVFLKRPHAR